MLLFRFFFQSLSLSLSSFCWYFDMDLDLISLLSETTQLDDQKEEKGRNLLSMCFMVKIVIN